MMSNATVNILVRDGQLRYEVMYQETYRHSYWRLGTFDSMHVAVTALQMLVGKEGHLVVQAGKCPAGTYKRGFIIHVQ